MHSCSRHFLPLLLLQIRMPSGMAGAKHSTFEGGIRNALVVQGPGVKTGATDNTMIAISDIFPTMVDIAGVNASVPAGLQLDGISFKSVLLPSGSSRRNNNRTADVDLSSESMSWTQQQSSLTWRYFFMLGPACWGPNAVPELAPDRYAQLDVSYSRHSYPTSSSLVSLTHFNC